MTSNITCFFIFVTDVITVQSVQTVRTNWNVLKKSVLPIITCAKMTIAFLMSGFVMGIMIVETIPTNWSLVPQELVKMTNFVVLEVAVSQ